MLVLEPTRELAAQVETAIRDFARFTDLNIAVLFGGVGYGRQNEALKKGADIIVATPGRLLDHLEQGTCHLDQVRHLVLDEADRMLDMGFFDDISYVASRCPRERQTLLFSATYPPGIDKLSQKFLRKPQEVKLAEQHDSSSIRQYFYEVDEGERLGAVGRLLDHFRPASTLAFCSTGCSSCGSRIWNSTTSWPWKASGRTLRISAVGSQ